MRFKSIKLKQDGTTDLSWEEANGQDVQTTTLVSRDAPLPEFKEAVADLKGDYLHILGLPSKVGDSVEMTGVSVYETKNGARAFVLKGKLGTPGGGTVGIPTPRVSEPSEDEEADGDSRLTEAQVERIETVLHEAARYASGKRVQQQLGLDDEAEAEAEEEEAEATA